MPEDWDLESFDEFDDREECQREDDGERARAPCLAAGGAVDAVVAAAEVALAAADDGCGNRDAGGSPRCDDMDESILPTNEG